MKECNIDVLEVRQVNRIAELRKKIGLSQSALGEILGVSQQTISLDYSRRSRESG